MPDRAPSMCAFRQALESLETLHPSMMLEQPAHLLVSRVSQCRSTSAFTVRVCKTTLQRTPLSPARQRRVRKLRTPRLRAYRSPRRQHDRRCSNSVTSCVVLSNQTNRHVVRLSGRTPVLSPLPCRLRRRNPSLRGAAKAAKALRYVADNSASPRETKKAILLGLPMMYGGYGLGIPRMNYEVKANPAHKRSRANRVFGAIYAGGSEA